jgi:hypothetical protein
VIWRLYVVERDAAALAVAVKLADDSADGLST